DDAARAIGEMLAYPDPPTAFFCLNNRITIGALGELWARHSDAGLVGFDDFELAHLMPRPFQVVASDPAELARVAADRLCARIGGDQCWPSTRTLPTYLVKRGLGASDNVVSPEMPRSEAPAGH